MKVLVTGTAGFIGSHVAHRLLDRGDDVVGVDNLNDYYDVRLKEARLARLQSREGFHFQRADVGERAGMCELFAQEKFHRVVHLAAQAGVRYSMENPFAYMDCNLTGFLTMLEGCRQNGVEHLVYASSSSVYGSNRTARFSVHDAVDHPLSLYGATKKANEMMAHSYSHLYGIPTTGLRFFTVYGPWGRPDMAMFLFTRAILADKPIDVFNRGEMWRDFTYIDDIVEGIVRVLDRVPTPHPNWDATIPDPASSAAPFRLYNIGNSQPERLTRLIDLLEENLGRPAVRNLLPMQPGDVPSTCADITDLERDVGFRPRTPLEVGVRRFVDWYREYYHETARTVSRLPSHVVSTEATRGSHPAQASWPA